MSDLLQGLLDRDPGGRGVAAVGHRPDLAAMARELAGAAHVALCSGFVHLETGRPETDGPPGALALGRALEHLGIQVTYLTDATCQELFEALECFPTCVPHLGEVAGEARRERAEATLQYLNPSHLVAVERAGRVADGTYRNHAGADITAVTDPLDELFLLAPEAGVVTMGIGDGGNEIGMGTLAPARLAPLTADPSVVPADHLVVAGTSNWGAYVLLAALSLETGEGLLPSGDDVEEDLHASLAAGAVDGLTGDVTPTVDGLGLEETLAFLEELRAAG